MYPSETSIYFLTFPNWLVESYREKTILFIYFTVTQFTARLQKLFLRYSPRFATNPDVDKTEFDAAIKKLYEEDRNKGPRSCYWSREIINKTIRMLNDFKEGRERTSGHYDKNKRYHVLKINGIEHLVHKGTDRMCPKIIVPTEEYYGMLSKWHLESSHGGRDRLTIAMNDNKQYVPRAAMCIYLNHCKKCKKVYKI